MPEANPRAGLFRTPLACALLSGALAVALHEAFNHLNFKSALYFRDVNLTRLLLYGFQAATLAIQLTGPLILRRNWNTFGRIVMATLLITIVLAMFTYVYYDVGRGRSTLGTPAQWQTAKYHSILRTTFRTLLLGASLAWLDRTKTYRSSALLALLGVLPAIIFFNFIHVWNGNGFDVGSIFWGTKEGQALVWLAETYYHFVPVVMAAIPIDRAYRAHIRTNPEDAYA